MTADTPKLSRMERILLTVAAKRDNGSLLPVTDNIGAQKHVVRHGIASLIKRGLAAEVNAVDPMPVWREEKGRALGVVITDAARAIVVVPPLTDAAQPTEGAPARSSTVPISRTYSPRMLQIIQMMKRPEGATTAAMAEATGLLPHSIRAALSGLRKRGLNIERSNGEHGSIYRIAKDQA